MKKIRMIFLSFLILITLLTPLNVTATANDSSQLIRVSLFPLEDSTSHYGNHPYYEYYYDYLQEISQYTGWSYEFVDASYDKSLQMLKNQEIDLICGIDITAERLEVFDYSSVPLMSSKYKLYVRAENDTIYYEDYDNFHQITIGILTNCTQTEDLDTLCTQKNISVEKKYFSSVTTLESALLDGSIDAIYAITVSDASAFRIIANFQNTPLYFATAKNSPLLADINATQKTIRDTVPYFEYHLYEEHIGDHQEITPYFTREELDYIASHPVIYFSSDPDWAPIESTNPDTNELEGISAEVLKLLGEYTGLNFSYKPSATFTEALNRLKHGEVELLTALSHDYTWADDNHINLSTAYLDSYIVMIHNPNRTTGQNCVALPADFNITSRIVESGVYEDVLYYSTAEECIQAVADGLADCTYTNYYIANYHLSNIAYRNLAATKLTSINENLCIAISKKADPLLLSIINKGLRCISSEKIDAIVLERTLYENPFSIRNIIYAYPETVILAIIGISTLAVIILLVALFIHHKRTRVIESISQTDALTGILNRGAVQAQITMILEKEKTNPDLVCPLISIDLDNFKSVNDNYGHAEGDLLLKAVARVLKHSVRQTDIVGRMGGDEFIVYLTNVNNKKTAEKVAAKLCTAVSALSLEKDEWCEITGSFGVAFGDSNSTWSSLYHESDVALYDAKEKGKNQYSVYHKDLDRNLP